MTLVADALDRAARQVSVATPTSWIAATGANEIAIRDDFLLETVDDILERVDLPAPISARTTVGDGAATTFAMPAGFKRLQRDMRGVYDTLQDQPCVPVAADGQWELITDIGATGVVKYYRMSGYEDNWTLEIYTAPSTNQVVVSYVTKNWMADSSGGTPGSAFTALTDVLLLPRRVIEAGIVWRFRERKGLPFEGKYNEYEVLISRLINDARTRRVINFGESPGRKVRWQDLVPAIIPET